MIILKSKQPFVQHVITGLVFGLVLLTILTMPVMGADTHDSIKVWNEKTKHGYRFFISSENAVPHSIQIKFSALRNLTASKALPLRFVISEKTNALALFDLEIVDAKKSHRFKYQSEWVIGDYHMAKHDDSIVYWLPYEHSRKFRVGQGYHGSFSHSKPGREYALDFSMPKGTPITAARDGIVAQVKQDSDRGGSSKSYEKDGNKISILHEDGTYADYVHLQKNGALVDVGDSVKAGQRIGLSGNTGRTTGPHLHFQVYLPTPEGTMKSLPTNFYNHLGEVGRIEVGVGLYAFHPGKPPFKATFGKTISNADYISYKKTIAQTNSISYRAESIDGTIVLFIQNGYPVAKEIEISMPRLKNLAASKSLPLTLTIKPMTERFALFVRAIEPSESFNYRIKWAYRDTK